MSKCPQIFDALITTKSAIIGYRRLLPYGYQASYSYLSYYTDKAFGDLPCKDDNLWDMIKKNDKYSCTLNIYRHLGMVSQNPTTIEWNILNVAKRQQYDIEIPQSKFTRCYDTSILNNIINTRIMARPSKTIYMYESEHGIFMYGDANKCDEMCEFCKNEEKEIEELKRRL